MYTYISFLYKNLWRWVSLDTIYIQCSFHLYSLFLAPVKQLEIEGTLKCYKDTHKMLISVSPGPRRERESISDPDGIRTHDPRNCSSMLLPAEINVQGQTGRRLWVIRWKFAANDI